MSDTSETKGVKPSVSIILLIVILIVAIIGFVMKDKFIPDPNVGDPIPQLNPEAAADATPGVGDDDTTPAPSGDAAEAPETSGEEP